MIPRIGAEELCGVPLLELYVWPGLSWPGHAPDGADNYSCDLALRNRL